MWRNQNKFFGQAIGLIVLVSFTLILASEFHMVSANAEEEESSDFSSIRWFDGNGCFHLGDPGKYLEEVLSGNVSDPVMARAILDAGMTGSPETVKQVESLAALLQKFQGTPRLFLPWQSKLLRKERREMYSAFKKSDKSGERGQLLIQGVGVSPRWNAQKYMGKAISSVIAVPADPCIIAEITRDWKDVSPDFEKMIIKTMRSRKMKKYSRIVNMNTIGQAYIQDLVPGPYLIWVNQHGFLMYLYRVIIEPNRQTALNLERQFLFRSLVHNIDLEQFKVR